MALKRDVLYIRHAEGRPTRKAGIITRLCHKRQSRFVRACERRIIGASGRKERTQMQINHPSTAPDYNAGELRSGKLTTKVLAVGRERALNCYRFSLEITGEETW